MVLINLFNFCRLKLSPNIAKIVMMNISPRDPWSYSKKDITNFQPLTDQMLIVKVDNFSNATLCTATKGIHYQRFYFRILISDE